MIGYHLHKRSGSSTCFDNWWTKFASDKLAWESPFAQLSLIYQKQASKALGWIKEGLKKRSPNIRLEHSYQELSAASVTVQSNTGVAVSSAKWEDVDGVVSLDLSLFSALSHLMFLHKQISFSSWFTACLQCVWSEALVCNVWMFVLGIWGLTCRHACSEAVFCLLGKFPDTAPHEDGSFGIHHLPFEQHD